jgi:hypothetical protein
MRKAIAATLALLLAGCDDTPGQRSAIVYPDAHDHSDYQTTRGFKSLSMCRQAAKESIAALPEPGKAGYQCGFKCEVDPAAPGRNNCQSIQD